MDLVSRVYKVTESFPREERFGLTNQIRRAAISIPSHIAEGAARQTRKEFINFLHMAQGSLSELDTQMELGKSLGYISSEDWASVNEQMERIDKMITGLIRHQSPHALRLTPHGVKP